jgi:hypothetical protein
VVADISLHEGQAAAGRIVSYRNDTAPAAKEIFEEIALFFTNTGINSTERL